MMRIHMFLVASAAFLAIAACGSEESGSSGGNGGASSGGSGATCTAGETKTCVGPGACQGGQSCTPNGTWTTCDCGSGTGGGSTGGTAGATGGGGSTGGQGGTDGGGGTGGACVPKTCVTIGVELNGKACGTVSDGCGVNYIDCGACDTSSNPWNACGGLPKPKPDGSQDLGTPNKCDGGCTQIWCSQPNCQGQKTLYTPSVICTGSESKLYVCTSDNQAKPPASSCQFKGDFVDSSAAGFGTNLTRYRWCCQ